MALSRLGVVAQFWYWLQQSLIVQNWKYFDNGQKQCSLAQQLAQRLQIATISPPSCVRPQGILLHNPIERSSSSLSNNLQSPANAKGVVL